MIIAHPDPTQSRTAGHPSPAAPPLALALCLTRRRRARTPASEDAGKAVATCRPSSVSARARGSGSQWPRAITPTAVLHPYCDRASVGHGHTPAVEDGSSPFSSHTQSPTRSRPHPEPEHRALAFSPSLSSLFFLRPPLLELEHLAVFGQIREFPSMDSKSTAPQAPSPPYLPP